MPAPFEIIAAPFTLYWAPTGEAFPDVDEVPAGNWAKVGTSGDLNYTEAGVRITHEQNVEEFRALGSTGPRKVFRTSESLLISLELADLSLAQYRLTMNQNVVASTAAGSGTPGFDTLNLYRGLDVNLIALLVRGDVSPFGSGWKMQYEVPFVYEASSPELVMTKGPDPAMLALEFRAVEDAGAASNAERFGRLIAQDADAV